MHTVGTPKSHALRVTCIISGDFCRKETHKRPTFLSMFCALFVLFYELESGATYFRIWYCGKVSPFVEVGFLGGIYNSTATWRRQRNEQRCPRPRHAHPPPRTYRSKRSKERTFIAMQNKLPEPRCSREARQSGTRTETSPRLLLSRRAKVKPIRGVYSPIGGGLVRIRVPGCFLCRFLRMNG